MICQLVLEYFQLQLSDILFFLEAFGLFGIFWHSKGLTAFLRPKNPKKASGLQKKPNVFKLQLKILQKKLTHHEKMPAFFLSLVPYHIDAHSSMILYNSESKLGLSVLTCLGGVGRMGNKSLLDFDSSLGFFSEENILNLFQY